MVRTLPNQWTIKENTDPDAIPRWFDAFLIDSKSQDMRPGTIYFYRSKLKLIDASFNMQGISLVSDITPDSICNLLVDLDASGHNKGGIHQVYRTLRAFLYWYAREVEPPNRINPLRNIKPPRLSIAPLKPIELSSLKLLLLC